MKTPVVIVDDHASVRQMVANMLAADGGYEVVGEGGTGFEGLKLCERKQPRLLVVDLQLPEMSGVELVQQIRAEMHDLRVLVYTGTQHRELIMAGLRTRPHGFVHKRDSLETLREAIRAVVTGCCYFTTFASRLLDECAGPDRGLTRLTARERVVLQMVGEGYSSKEMADRLAIATKTVDHHRGNLMQKLGIHDIAGLTRVAVRQGLVSLD